MISKYAQPKKEVTLNFAVLDLNVMTTGGGEESAAAAFEKVQNSFLRNIQKKNRKKLFLSRCRSLKFCFHEK
jgi:hypothetical protein